MPPFFHAASNDRDSAVESTKLHLGVGEVYIAQRPTLTWTVLGSCVAVILFVPTMHVSAICHAQLPAPFKRDFDCANGCPHPCFRHVQPLSNLKFITCSVDYMVESILTLGAPKRGIACAIIGGATVLPVANDAYSVGERNVETARRVLEQHSLATHYEDVGGSHGRTLTYHTGNGQIRLDVAGAKHRV